MCVIGVRQDILWERQQWDTSVDTHQLYQQGIKVHTTHLHSMSSIVQTLLELLPCCCWRSERTIVQAASRAAREDGLNSIERSHDLWCCWVRAVETGEGGRGSIAPRICRHVLRDDLTERFYSAVLRLAWYCIMSNTYCATVPSLPYLDTPIPYTHNTPSARPLNTILAV